MTDLIRLTDNGLYCEPGDFYVDPWGNVDRALITHAHSDHARFGAKSYLAAEPGILLLRGRLGEQANISGLPYGEQLAVGDVDVSFHPAGHVLGSAQIRIAHKGQVWVVSGDYKIQADPTCEPIEPLACHAFITESTFGLPIYRWHSNQEVFAEINSWWQSNKEIGKASIIYGYSLGKAQRILAGIDASIGPIYTHGAVERINALYSDCGVSLPETSYVAAMPKGTRYDGALIVAPPSAHGTPWLRQFGKAATAFASGWMRVRGARRRRSIDRGFALSDHADWPGLLTVIKETHAERVIVTHGNAMTMVRWLQEAGFNAESFRTQFEDNFDDDVATKEAEATG